MVDWQKAFGFISSRVWICTKPQFWLSSMKLHNSDNHYNLIPFGVLLWKAKWNLERQSSNFHMLMFPLWSVLGNTKWDILYDSWSLSIMGYLWSLLSKRNWGFEKQSWNFLITNVCFVWWTVEYEARHGAGVSIFQCK